GILAEYVIAPVAAALLWLIAAVVAVLPATGRAMRSHRPAAPQATPGGPGYGYGYRGYGYSITPRPPPSETNSRSSSSIPETPTPPADQTHLLHVLRHTSPCRTVGPRGVGGLSAPKAGSRPGWVTLNGHPTCGNVVSSLRSKELPVVARVVVDVMPKPEILDPQGQAVAGALPRLGFEGVTEVRQGKHFELEVDDSVDDDTLAKIAEGFLANPVIEDWTVRRVDQ